MKPSSFIKFQFLLIISFSISLILTYDSYISITRNYKINQNKLSEKTENKNSNESENLNQSSENNFSESFLNKTFDIYLTINHKEDFYDIEIFVSNQEAKKTYTAQMPTISNKFQIPQLNAIIEFKEIYTKENLIMNIKIGEDLCEYHLKRVFWGNQQQYDFTLEIRDRKEAFDFGIFIYYKNKEDFLARIQNYITILILEGEKKCGKTFLCSKLANNTNIMLDYSLNTEGISGIFERNMLFVDSEGLGTEKSNNLFNNTFQLFNAVDKNNKNFNSKEKNEEKISNDLMDEYNENQRNLLFQIYLRDAVRNLGNFYLLVQNQISLNAFNHLEEVINKYLAAEDPKDLRILVVYNYKDIDLVSKIKRKIYNDIISRHKVQAIETNQKANEHVRAYDDLFYRLKGNSKIRVTYLILGAYGKESGNYFNDETLGYITSQAKNFLNFEIFNPIERLVNNLNEMFLEHINPASIDGKEYKESDISHLKCVKLENFGDDLRLKNLEKIAFSEHPLCRSVWDANVKNAQKLIYEVYIQNSILNLEVFLPFVKSLEEIEFTHIDFAKNDFRNVCKIFLKANVNFKSEASLLFERLDFIRQRRIKHFVIDEVIRLPFNLKMKKIVNTCDFSLNHGVLKFKCPLIE